MCARAEGTLAPWPNKQAVPVPAALEHRPLGLSVFWVTAALTTEFRPKKLTCFAHLHTRSVWKGRAFSVSPRAENQR